MGWLQRLFSGSQRKRHKHRHLVWCSNSRIGRHRIYGRVHYWSGYPMCRRCYRFFTGSGVRVIRR